jgi:hypothetical protein
LESECRRRRRRWGRTTIISTTTHFVQTRRKLPAAIGGGGSSFGRGEKEEARFFTELFSWHAASDDFIIQEQYLEEQNCGAIHFLRLPQRSTSSAEQTFCCDCLFDHHNNKKEQQEWGTPKSRPHRRITLRPVVDGTSTTGRQGDQPSGKALSQSQKDSCSVLLSTTVPTTFVATATTRTTTDDLFCCAVDSLCLDFPG